MIRVALSVLVLLAMTRPAKAQRCAGVSFPATVQVGDATLRLQGLGLRRASMFRVRVFVGGLYLAAPSDDGPAVARSHATKRLTLHFLRGAGRDRMESGFREPLSAAGVAGELPELIALLPEEIAEGTRVAFTHLPGRGLEVRVAGRARGVVGHDAFARAFFGVFLGPDSPDPRMTRGLLGGDC